MSLSPWYPSAFFLVLFLCTPVWAQVDSGAPDQAEVAPKAPSAAPAEPKPTITPIPDDIKIVEQLGAQVPQQLVFTDEAGQKRPLAAYLDGTQPVILVPVYYSCPLLCNITLNRLVGTLQALPWSPGGGYRIVTFSIDARERPELAKAKKASYLKELARPGAESGWHFLTSSAESIRQLTDAVGFGYRYDQERLEYLHRAALILLSPNGEVTRYLRGSYTQPTQLKIGLLKSGDGSLGTLKERLWAGLFAYDDEKKKYQLDSGLIGSILAVMVLIPLGMTVLILRRGMSA